LAEPYALEVCGVCKHYKERVALSSVDLAVPSGHVHGLLGPNGAGKTTLLRVLLGLVRPDAGRVQLLGSPMTAIGGPIPDDVAGFVETPNFYSYLSGRQNLTLLARLDGRDKNKDTIVGKTLEQVGLAPHADVPVASYSAGMRQRLGLAAVLIRSPRLLLLDEPTSSLDPPGAADVRTIIRRLGDDGVTIVLSSHDMSEVEQLCASLTFLLGGRVVFSGSTDEFRSVAPKHILSIHTSDDDGARAVAARHAAVRVLRSGDGAGLELSADTAALDRYVLDLARSGIAVRRLERKTRSLEDIFTKLAG
jgi:ABC-2 type transport system ATP-binding protein